MNKLQLLDQKGFPIIKSSVNTVYQTDWQGRVALSNAPRTNLVQVSQVLATTGGWGQNGQLTVTLNAAAAPNGAIAATQVSNPPTVNQGGFITCSTTVASGAPLVISMFCKYVSGATTIALMGQGAAFPVTPGVLLDFSTGATSPYSASPDAYGAMNLGNGWFRLWLAARAGAAGAPAFVFQFNQVAAAQALLFGAQIENGTQLGVYIPTTSAPVTVTDYADNGDGTVALGQDTPDTSTFQWSGTGISKGETELSPYNVSVSQQIINPVVGSNSILQLVDSTGFPLSTANIQSIYKTDWQGRVALSNTPRTNWIPFSTVTNNYPAGISIATGQPDPKGGAKGITFTVTANQSAGQSGMGVYWLSPSGVPTSGSCNWSLWIKASRAGIQLQAGTNGPGGIILADTTGAWQLVSGSSSFVSADAMNVYGSHYATGSQMLVVGDSITMAFGGEYQGAAQPVIPTTSAPVAVTDYADNGDGTVALGQYAANTDVYDWSGTGVGWR